MERRKFILGAGAAATGGSALIGSGAFSAMEAERDVTISVVSDSDALLRLGPCTDEDGNEKPNGAYVDEVDGMMRLSISEDNKNSPPDGDGVNVESFMKFHNVFEIENQGTRCVCVNFGFDGGNGTSVPEIPDDAEVPDRFENDFQPGDDAIVFYKGSDEDDRLDLENTDPDDGFELCPGESQCIGFNVRAFGFDSGKDLLDDLDLSFVAFADADCANGDPKRPEGVEITKVKFKAEGNGKIESNPENASVKLNAWVLEQPRGKGQSSGGGQDQKQSTEEGSSEGRNLLDVEFDSFDTSNNLGPEVHKKVREEYSEVDSISNLGLVALVFPDKGIAFVNKTWNSTDRTLVFEPNGRDPVNTGIKFDDGDVDGSITDSEDFKGFLKDQEQFGDD